MSRRASPLIGLLLLGAIACIMPSASIVAQEAPQVPEGIDYQPDLEYGRGGETPLFLDLARPAKAANALPCIVVIHGGAWRGGNKKGHTDLIFTLAKAGYIATTVQYRFCPDQKFPAQIEDVKCAVRYLRAHAQTHSIDAEHMGAVGVSAGAHLSMLLGTMQESDGLEGEGGWPEQSSAVQAVVSFAGPTNLGADDIPEVSKGLVKDFLGGTLADVPDQYRLSSPLSYVTQGDAPHLLFQGTKDPLVPHTQAIMMAEALSLAEVPGRVELLIGAGHGWGGVDQQRSFDEMIRFFDRHLKFSADAKK